MHICCPTSPPAALFFSLFSCNDVIVFDFTYYQAQSLLLLLLPWRMVLLTVGKVPCLVWPDQQQIGNGVLSYRLEVGWKVCRWEGGEEFVFKVMHVCGGGMWVGEHKAI